MWSAWLPLLLWTATQADVPALAIEAHASWTLPGVACDATSDERGALWSAEATDAQARSLSWLPAHGPLRSWRAPPDAVAADLCAAASGHLEALFLTPAGLVEGGGGVRLAGASPLAAQPGACLWLTPLCGGPARQELRLPLREGWRIAAPGQPPAMLRLPAPARTYGARARDGLQVERPYALAVSYFVPTLFDADADGDGRPDLWIVHEDRVSLFLRGADGRLPSHPHIGASLVPRGPVRERVDVRARVADHDGDGRAELLALIVEGTLPARARAALWGLPELREGHTGRRILDEEGYFQFMPAAPGVSAGRVWLLQTPTSRLSLAAAWASGKSELVVWSVAGAGSATRARRHRSLHLYSGEGAGRRAGAWPQLVGDLTGDGVADLLDGSEPGRWQIFAGEAGGFRAQPAWRARMSEYEAREALAHPRGWLLEERRERDTGGRAQPTRVVLFGRRPPPGARPAVAR